MKIELLTVNGDVACEVETSHNESNLRPYQVLQRFNTSIIDEIIRKLQAKNTKALPHFFDFRMDLYVYNFRLTFNGEEYTHRKSATEEEVWSLTREEVEDDIAYSLTNMVHETVTYLCAKEAF